ncbi:MAG TPA: tetratricopeptide repeat protein [Polyangiaceae bacterium]|jgi:TolA-binding protein|nr:tetratricopeptide repeat protein [Polyangiaceae bacterium]
MKKTHGGTSPEDLSVLARRGLLSEAEESELERALQADPELQVAHRVGLDMDLCTAVRAGDEALVSKAADAAMMRVAASGLASPHAARAPRAGRRFASVLLVAALVCATGAAAAMWAGLVPARFLGRAASGSGATGAVVPPQINVPPTASAALGAQPKDPEPVADSLREMAPVVVHPSPVVAGAAHASAESTAAALFTSANAARRGGNFSNAEKLYSQLIARYPSSDEARLARLSLGKLLLAQGDSTDAERQFGQYLKGEHGELAEEALVSRAQSLRNLGRANAERVTWQRLLAEHPNSVYAAEARGRIDALRRVVNAPGP